MYPQNNGKENIKTIPNKTWKISGNILAGFIDSNEAIAQSINLRLKNIVGEHMIYEHTYGSEIHSLLGENYDMICLKLPSIIEEALSFDDRIMGADNFEFNKGKDNLFVKFRVILFRDSFDMEVSI